MKKQKKLLKTINIITLALLVGLTTNNATQAIENIRDNYNNPISMKNDLNYGENSKYEVDYLKKFSPYSQKTATLRGGVSQLLSLVGRSQLIRLDEPVKRISVANPALADVILLSRQELLLNGKASGVTSMIIWGEKGDPVFFDLHVKNDTTAFLEALKEIAPEENDINIRFADVTSAQSSASSSDGGGTSSSSTSKSVIFSGNLSSTITRDKIASLATTYGFSFIDMTESPTPQVVLEVKIVEASRSLTKYNKLDQLSGGTGVDPRDIDLFINPFKGTNINIANAGAPEILIGTIRTPILNTQTTLKIKETKGLIKVLAEPKLVTLNKQKASFNAGQQVPVPTGVDPESGMILFDYKNVGVNLEFTPEIQEKTGKIKLKLTPEVNEIDSTITVNQGNGIVIYGIRTRKTDTTVELEDGQTLIIAGLLQRNDSVTSDQIPFLGDIPILGNLFASKEWRKGETELMIFVTPKIIKSANLVNGV